MFASRIRVIVLALIAVTLTVLIIFSRMGASTEAAARQAKSGEPPDRLKAIKTLETDASVRAVEALGGIVADPDDTVACRAIEALAKAGGPAALPQLRTAVTQDARPAVREAGVVATGRLGRQTDPAILVQALRSDKSPQVRAAAARWIGNIRYWEGMPELIGAMNDESLEVRRDAGAAVRRLWARDFLYRADDPPEERARRVEFIRLSWEDYRASPVFRMFQWKQENKP